MPQRYDAKLLEVLRREVRQDRLVYLILAERGLILSKAEAPQPDHDVHDGRAPQSWWQYHLLGREKVSIAVWGLGKPAEVRSPLAGFTSSLEAEGAGRNMLF